MSSCPEVGRTERAPDWGGGEERERREESILRNRPQMTEIKC